ncbi:hypothetical protein B0293_39555 [Amycolatopsis azurea DSM 43854]|uniref:Uncharacterized protein n=1 Tax=Amycolatopsis azurea DSM 43854 TaxID=1238180 RepID=A0ABX3J1G2_9PSEU|nr:hypothetical protein B0293_39555 [Amycolatopsis azurea DSM 43854]
MACSFARPHADLGCRESHVRNVESCERGFRNASGTPPRHENRQTRGEVREGLLEGPRVPQGGLHGPVFVHLCLTCARVVRRAGRPGHRP